MYTRGLLHALSSLQLGLWRLVFWSCDCLTDLLKLSDCYCASWMRHSGLETLTVVLRNCDMPESSGDTETPMGHIERHPDQEPAKRYSLSDPWLREPSDLGH